MGCRPGRDGEKIPILPWRSGDEPYELSHFAPRLGYAYRLTDRTVLRGGYRIYFTQMENDAAHQSNLNAQTIIPEARYDGRPDFASNPGRRWPGRTPGSC